MELKETLTLIAVIVAMLTGSGSMLLGYMKNKQVGTIGQNGDRIRIEVVDLRKRVQHLEQKVMDLENENRALISENLDQARENKELRRQLDEAS